MSRDRSVLAAFRELDDGRHRAELYRMWARAHDAGFPYAKALETIGERSSARTEAARRWVIEGARRGRDLAELVRSGGDRFDEFERSLLTWGEESGHLDDALHLLGDFYQKKHALMLHVKKKLAYPLVTGLLACFIAPFPLLFFGNVAAYLVGALSGVAVLLVASKGIVTALAARYGRQPPVARARMARALATAIEAGLPVQRAVRLAADASAHPEIRRFVERIDERTLSTTPMGETLARCPHVTPEFAATLATAERTGDFSPLTRLAEMYEDGFR